MRLIRKKDNSIILSRLYVADSLFKRCKGLLGRKFIGRDEGLLIPKCNAIHTIGMRFPIDVVFLDEKGKIVHIKHSFPMGKIMFVPIWPARFVVEMFSGRCKEVNLQVGEVLLWEGD